ncbi:MAG: saccharopine dehydrogenase NADP-binding domain-containing protein [Gemmatimonadaceae bacterium]|nr:saccharopine dehydrogenase NADP-binding domain-containing protein [Gemmatimonadaceae bacterium]
MRVLVLGAGLQGSACAFDLLQNPAVSRVRLADKTVGALAPFLASLADPRLDTLALDFGDREAVRAVMGTVDAVACAAPYYFNFDLAALAVEAGVHFADLGGNTEIVFSQFTLADQAKAKGVSVLPDCGLAPGMVNTFAEHGIRQLDTVSRVRMFVGGLPQHPEPPLNYQIVYSLEGALDYYTTPSWILRDGARTTVTALTEIEPVAIDGVGTLEAFHTAGGLSTMAFRHEGRIAEMEYKTLRYPGHAELMAAMRALGLLSLEPLDVKGQRVVPRDVFVAAVSPHLRKPGRPDLVAARVVVEGTKGGAPARRQWDIVDRADDARGLSAMMRCTGFTLSIVVQLQAGGQVAPGVHTMDTGVPAEPYIAALGERGIRVTASS